MSEAPERTPLEMVAFAAWVNCPAGRIPDKNKAHTCEATMTAWRRVTTAIRDEVLRTEATTSLAVTQELPEIKALVDALREISRNVRWEINPSNYTHDDVCHINQDWCDVGNIADAALTQWEKKDD